MASPRLTKHTKTYIVIIEQSIQQMKDGQIITKTFEELQHMAAEWKNLISPAIRGATISIGKIKIKKHYAGLTNSLKILTATDMAASASQVIGADGIDEKNRLLYRVTDTTIELYELRTYYSNK